MGLLPLLLLEPGAVAVHPHPRPEGTPEPTAEKSLENVLRVNLLFVVVALAAGGCAGAETRRRRRRGRVRDKGGQGRRGRVGGGAGAQAAGAVMGGGRWRTSAVGLRCGGGAVLVSVVEVGRALLRVRCGRRRTRGAASHRGHTGMGIS